MDLDKDILGLGSVYAEALIAAATEQHAEAEVAEEFTSLTEYMRRDTAFAAFLINTAIEPEQRRQSLERLFRGRMHDLVLNLLQVLNRRRRSDLVPAVARCVQLLVESRRDQQEITVQSAVPLWDEIRGTIRSTVQKWIGKTPILIEEVNPNLIGGLVFRLGDVRVDASIVFQLGQMHRKLRERITHEVHRGADYLADANV